jgi:hypothetical protein
MKLLLSVYSIVTAIFGILAFVVPAMVISWYSPIPADAVAETGFRLGGSLGIGLAILGWYARNSDSNARGTIVMAITLTNALGCIAAFIAATSGSFNGGAWFEVVSYALWTILFILVARMSPSTSHSE